MANKEIKKVLVANRGEIAIRVFRACNDLSLNTVAIYSKEDVCNLFRTKADESYLVGEDKTPLGAYLDIEGIIKIAKERNVDAIHPGYGFLAENAEFARACEANGIKFIGPSSDVLNQMGDKLNAKELALRCNVPTVPGSTDPLESVQDAITRAESYGYPVILKAAAGGGGRGMRRVNNSEELPAAFEMVKSEAIKAFSCGDIFMEKFIEEPKHIEVQILADEHGNVVHLYERDCSLQRRYQKVVEFTPSITIPEDKRQALLADAVKIAKEVNYASAGTVEFLVDKNGDHYFIEMNPRIQVEHTVTEEVTGVDIVRAQILIAAGIPLSDPRIGINSQDDVRVNGFAVQCRVTTEDPKNNFAPDTGKITVYRSGGGNGVRLDAGNAYAGAVISPYYDSLLVKITTRDNTFEGAVKKALRTVSEVRVRGVKTNIPYLKNILTNETFISGNCNTGFIDQNPQLFEFDESRDRANKILTYIGEKAVNAPIEVKTYETPVVPKSSGNPRDGIRQLLIKEGPDAVKKFVLDQKKVLVTDTTFRDAHQSLLATRVRTRDFQKIAGYTADTLADAFSLEMWGGATFDVAYRFLHESPWERLEILRKAIPNIPFQMLLRGANAVGYANYPDNLIREFIKEAAVAGIDVFRIFDSLNWLPGMEVAIDEALKQNKLVEATICYTGDILDTNRDKYSLNYYVKLAKEIEKRGAHLLCIKDMAGLVKPYAAKKLVAALKNEIGIPVHFHTHDTSGNQVAALLLATEAGVDIVDTAISSMSSLTSQPSMNAFVAALKGDARDTGIDLDAIQKLTEYWEAVRTYYREYEAGQVAPATDIYRYEIPGGQYTNLKPQVESLGLGDKFLEVKEKYREVNDMLGDIVKVTPSSKMVGDLAIFMVQNNLTAENIVEKGANLNFPDSAVSYFKGMMGQPEGGFPEDIQKIVLKGEEPISCRPGELLDPINWDDIRAIVSKNIKEPTMQDLVSYVMYPKVMEDYFKIQKKYGKLQNMDTPIFFKGMVPGETTYVDIEDGKTLVIRYVGLGDLNENGTRQVIFELNGIRRELEILDNVAAETTAKVVLADPDDTKQVGSSIPGMVSKVNVKVGDEVKENQVLAIIEAMKMETSVVALQDGVVGEVLIDVGQNVKAGELLIKLK
ncbi:MAG: pyruvate carboxylase [Clostridia bacterium]|nr:pyruvate carboxylase [Clostridia bacterium]